MPKIVASRQWSNCKKKFRGHGVCVGGGVLLLILHNDYKIGFTKFLKRFLFNEKLALLN